MRRILVTGGNGQLGEAIRRAAEGSANSYTFATIDELDICNRTDVERYITDNKIDVVINCAAYTDVEGAEDNDDIAESVNCNGVLILASLCLNHNIKFIHISTDYVFGGDPYNTPCTEDKKGTPTGVYGQSKLHGEQNIQKVGCNHLIIRTAWLYSEFGRNFVKTMLALTASKEQLKVVFDQVGTPTYAYDLAAAIFDIVENRKYVGNDGIYHYSNEGVCSWYDFTKMIAEYSGNVSCNVQPCHSNEFPSKVVRPAYSVLDKTKIKNTFGLSVPYWTDSLKVCLENIKNC